MSVALGDDMLEAWATAQQAAAARKWVITGFVDVSDHGRLGIVGRYLLDGGKPSHWLFNGTPRTVAGALRAVTANIEAIVDGRCLDDDDLLPADSYGDTQHADHHPALSRDPR